ncbi:hypothetical protein L208DRAFT_1379924 [Tricholoma matsutake]|nr:hypothetical protein L208DRAFT_1379924 [Tricholoma matsutake 945]
MGECKLEVHQKCIWILANQCSGSMPKVWEGADEQQVVFFAPSLFFFNEDIKMLQDYFVLLTSVECIAALISHNPQLNNLHTATALYSVISAEKKQQAQEKQAAAQNLVTAIHNPVSKSTEASSEGEPDNVNDHAAAAAAVSATQSGIKWQLICGKLETDRQTIIPHLQNL